MPAPKPWFLEIFDDHSIRILYSQGDQTPEAKCPGPAGKPHGAITAISCEGDLAKAGTLSSVRLRLISVSCVSTYTGEFAIVYGVCM